MYRFCKIGAHGWGWVEVLSQIGNSNFSRYYNSYFIKGIRPAIFIHSECKYDYVSTIRMSDPKSMASGWLLRFLEDFCEIFVCACMILGVGIRLNHKCCGSASCCSFLWERERVHLSPHIPSDPAFARWAPVRLAPMAPPLRRQSGISRIRVRCNRLQNRFSPFSPRWLDSNSPRVILTDHFLRRCILFGGGSRRYRCYILNPIVVIDVFDAILLEFNEHDDIWYVDVFIVI